jgi:hypothetical protein
MYSEFKAVEKRDISALKFHKVIQIIYCLQYHASVSIGVTSKFEKGLTSVDYFRISTLSSSP